MCVVSYLLVAVSMCFVHMMQPTAEPAKMARTKTNIARPVPAIGPLMLHHFSKLPAMSILFAKVRIHARHTEMLNVVSSELKNKSVVFIFLRVLCSQGGCPLLCHFLLFDDAKVYIHIDKNK